MSLYDWTRAREMLKADPPFCALIMTAMMKADPSNVEKLRAAFPETWTELDRRYHSRLALKGISGALPEDAP